MILLSKIPKNLESVVQMYSQIVSDEISDGKDCDPYKVVAAIRHG